MATLEELARKYIGKSVIVEIDRPLGSKHPRHGFFYPVNYGFVPGTIAHDGEGVDAYYLGVEKALKIATGICIGIVHRKDDDDDKLIVVPEGVWLSDEEILGAVQFQEQWFDHELIRS